ncbi:MAG: hypothetical protein V7607_2600 [Solirubrobacteraceae bacterium]
MTGPPELSRAERIDMTQQAVLSILLDAHPGLRSIEEVVCEMTDRPDELCARDEINNAIRDLVGAGLVHRHGAFLFATRAAVRFEELRI